MADNTFKTARNLGTFGNGIARNIKIEDALNSNDKVDFLKFKVQPGRSFRLRSSFELKGGAMNSSIYYDDPTTKGPILLYSSKVLPGKSTSESKIPEIPASLSSATFYIKFDRPTRDLNYKYSLRLG